MPPPTKIDPPVRYYIVQKELNLGEGAPTKCTAAQSTTTSSTLLRGHVHEDVLAGRQVGDASRPGQLVGNILGRLDTSQLHETISGLRQTLGQHLSGLGVSLGRDDGGDLLLLRLLHEEARLLRLLLGHLLQLDGLRELLAERQMRDRDVVEDHAELGRALDQRLAYLGMESLIEK